MIRFKSKKQSSETMSIRLATLADIASIREVARLSWKATYANSIQPETQALIISRSYSDQTMRYGLTRSGVDSWFWVVLAGSTIVGFGEIELRPGVRPDAELTRLYFLPEWQGQGLGTALLKEMRHTLLHYRPDSDYTPSRLWLTVKADNSAAINFYEQRGFRFFRDYILTVPHLQHMAVKEYVLNLL